MRIEIKDKTQKRLDSRLNSKSPFIYTTESIGELIESKVQLNYTLFDSKLNKKFYCRPNETQLTELEERVSSPLAIVNGFLWSSERHILYVCMTHSKTSNSSPTSLRISIELNITFDYLLGIEFLKTIISHLIPYY